MILIIIFKNKERLNSKLNGFIIINIETKKIHF